VWDAAETTALDGKAPLDGAEICSSYRQVGKKQMAEPNLDISRVLAAVE
jgi:hypothetical protein